MTNTPPSDLERVALITGGTGALGTAVTKALLARGPAAVTYRSEPDAARLRAAAGSAASQLLLVRADVTDSTQAAAAVDQTIARFGRLDHLVNLVGGWAGGAPVWETAEADWDRMIALNLKSAFICCRAVLPHMIARRYGRVLNVSSRAAVRPGPGAAAYAAAKMGVITLTETLALEVSDHGDITANCILPSVIDTAANRQSMPKADHSRWVTPTQLAAIIAWLISDEATPINGAAIPVYGRA